MEKGEKIKGMLGAPLQTPVKNRDLSASIEYQVNAHRFKGAPIRGDSSDFKVPNPATRPTPGNNIDIFH